MYDRCAEANRLIYILLLQTLVMKYISAAVIDSDWGIFFRMSPNASFSTHHVPVAASSPVLLVTLLSISASSLCIPCVIVPP